MAPPRAFSRGGSTTRAARQQVLREVEGTRATEALLAIDAVEASARQSSTAYLVLAGSALLLALALALAAARSITRPLRELTDAADDLATERLPKLVDALRQPIDDDQDMAAALEPIAVRTDDEIGRLAHAFNAVQLVAVDVAAEQSLLLKKGISDLYVNLARRNQALIDRQIQLLDQLEAEEQDTEVLQHLYLLDHLATRMRRNAESLLILAGSESGPRRSKPIEVVDVVRAALSEVEDYERIELGSLAAATLHGPSGSDVAHLVAELLENATQFSPPDSAVRVDGAMTAGTYQIVITDHGVGMRQEQLDELNEVLRDPPVTGLALGRALGCLVAARLAARHGITVRLRSTEGEGVAAYVILPQHLLVEEQGEARPTPAPPPVAAAPVPEADPDEASVLAERHAPPARLSDALPARSEFDAGIQALLDREGEPTLVEPPLATRQAGGRSRRRGRAVAPPSGARRHDAGRAGADRRPGRPTEPGRGAGAVVSLSLWPTGRSDLRRSRRRGGIMSEQTNELSFEARNLSWLLNGFVRKVPGVSEAVVLSADGLPMAVSEELDRESAERFAAVASGLIGLAYGAAGRFGGGRVNEVIVEMEHAFLFVTGISDGSALAAVADSGCDIGLVGYEMAVFVDRAGSVLTPELRAELQGALLR